MLKKKIRLRRAPSSGISLSGGQVSDGRLRRGLIVAAEHLNPQNSVLWIKFQSDSGCKVAHTLCIRFFIIYF